MMQPNATLPTLFEGAINPAAFLRPIEFLREEHERQRWFCEQLAILADDIWQPGRERLAASLLNFAIVDFANNLEDERELLAPALFRCGVADTGPKKVVAEMDRRHQGISTLTALTIDGLHRLASGDAPLVPTHFILSALGLAEILKRNLDWEDAILLPLAASELTEAEQRDLGSAMARRRGASPLN